MKHKQPNWETWVTRTASPLPYPVTPNISQKVQTKLTNQQQAARSQPATSSFPRLATAFAILLVLFGFLLVVPSVRAGILNFFNIGTINIFLDETSPPGKELIPVPLPDLPGKTTLTTARESVNFPILFPPSLDDPDFIFQYNQFGEAVTLVWADENIVLQILNGQIIGNKLQPEAAETTFVANRVAIWVTGEHLLTLYDERFGVIVGMTRFVKGNVLIWQDGEVTYRLEIKADFESAKELAESIYD